jgi:hypothetical protein
MRITIETIPHEQQRYPTCGDWIFEPDGTINILVSQMDEDYSFLVAFHELIEVWLTKKRGISQASVDEFDMQYESNRPEGDLSEPGNSTSAPYFREHQFATMMEEKMARELGVDWQEYSRVVESL